MRHALLNELIQALVAVFRPVKATTPVQAAAAGASGPAACHDASLFACFTAFTHPRRLQIIRHLARESQGSPGELAAALSMSRRACERHLDKLWRRGMVRRTTRGPVPRYRLAVGRGLMHKAALAAVRQSLIGGRS